MRDHRDAAVLFAALTALLGGPGPTRTPDGSEVQRQPRDEAQVAAKRAKRRERGQRQYERWLQSGGRP